MIREGGKVTPPGTSQVELLTNTQFSTITEAMDFVVRLVTLDASNAAEANRPTYVFRRGSDRLSQGSVSIVPGGIGAAEDAEIFRGRIMPGNLYLEVTPGAAAAALQFDITAY